MHSPLFTNKSVHIFEEGDVNKFDSFDIEITKVKEIDEATKAIFVSVDKSVLILPYKKMKYFEKTKYFKEGIGIQEDIYISYERDFWEEFKEVNKWYFKYIN